MGDAAGNTYTLNITQLGVGPSTVTLLFTCTASGAVNPNPNTVNVPSTIVLGVTSINNASAALSVGAAQESDGAYRLRIAKSFAISGQGRVNSLEAALLNIPGITFALVVNNNTANT